MERQAVSSSNVAEVGYDSESLTLEVAYHNGGVYQYLDVPASIFQELMSGVSIGSYLHHYVKNIYRCIKL